MQTLKILANLIIIFSLIACEKAADVSAPKSYDKDNISFSYPKNWKITEDEKSEEVHYIFIESPGDAITIIQIYPLNLDDSLSMTLQEYAEWFSRTAKEETPLGMRGIGTFTEFDKSINDTTAHGIREKFSITLAGLDVLHIAEYFLFKTEQKAMYVINQAAHEDIEKVIGGFNLIIESLKIIQ